MKLGRILRWGPGLFAVGVAVIAAILVVNTLRVPSLAGPPAAADLVTVDQNAVAERLSAASSGFRTG